MTEHYSKIKELINQSKSAIVVSHIDPDGDALGSMIAMALILEQMGLEVIMFSNDGVPNTYKFLQGSDKIITHPPKKEYDIMVSVDASNLDSIGEKRINAKKIINIDHHPDNSNFGDVNCVELLSSVGELVFKIAKEFGIKINQQMAEAMYVSIITDTGNFRYSNTLPSTFEVAKELAELGANPYYLATKVYDSKNIESLKILALTLSKMQYTPDRKIVWASVTKDMIRDTQAKSEDLIGIIDHLRTVKEAEVALMFREDKSGMIKVNFRSKGKVNVSKVANELGGGGHVHAAGCSLDLPIGEAQQKVVELLKKEL